MTYPSCVTSGNSNELASPTFRVLLYSRVSSQHQVQTGHSLDAQPEALGAWAESNGWRVEGEISDPGRTGRNTQRQGFNDLMKAIHSFRPDAVVVTRLSRFMRNARLTLNAVHDMRELGVAIICKDEPIDTRQRGISDMFLAILASASLVELLRKHTGFPEATFGASFSRVRRI